VRCQARPAAARRGFREDDLCANMANTSAQFHDRAMPVCRMHKAAYGRWGDGAESKAEHLWGWPPHPARPEPER